MQYADKLRGKRILVVDDEPDNLGVVKQVLDVLGVDCVALRSGADVWVILIAGRFDAVVMDVQMPGVSGTDLVTSIRAADSPRIARMPTVVLTAHAMPGDRDRFLAMGFDY